METYRDVVTGDAISALGDPTRRAVFERLASGPQPVNKLAAGLPVSRPAVSQHLRVLREAGLVSERREGTRRIYALAPRGLADLRGYFDTFWSQALDSYQAAAQAHQAQEADRMTTETAELTIHKTIHVAAPLERAFDVFTNGMTTWWPVATHSVDTGELSVDWRVGGLAVELADGVRHEWFDVVEFMPPHAVGMRWRVNPEAPATDLRVTFTPEGDGTRVELFHTGWEAYGENAAERSDGYREGWDVVLGGYTGVVALTAP